MGYTFSTNIRHFLNPNDSIPDELPPPARAMLDYIGAIVASISSDPLAHSIDTGVPCHPAPKQKPCAGKIVGFLDLPTDKVHWECPACGNQGVIFDWEGTIWDRSEDQEKKAN